MPKNDPKPIRYGIAKKGQPYVMIVVDTYEEAEQLIKGKENILEIREVIE